MSDAVIWGLVLSSVLVVMVRRRTIAIALVAVQSLLLGAEAILDASGERTELLVGVTVLVAKGIILPVGLVVAVRRTREAGRIASERHSLVRLAAALAAALILVPLVPRFGLESARAEHAVVGVLALGIATAVVRRPTMFQALGFLVAENALYLAALSAPGGMPGFIEVGLVFDLVVIVSVAGVFSAKIREELGTSDTSLLGGLRD